MLLSINWNEILFNLNIVLYFNKESGDIKTSNDSIGFLIEFHTSNFKN